MRNGVLSYVIWDDIRMKGCSFCGLGREFWIKTGLTCATTSNLRLMFGIPTGGAEMVLRATLGAVG